MLSLDLSVTSAGSTGSPTLSVTLPLLEIASSLSLERESLDSSRLSPLRMTSSPPADDESSQAVRAKPSTPARAQTTKLLANEFFIKNRRKDLPPKKITRRHAKSHPSTHRKRSFFGDFLSKIFYMTHRETYRKNFWVRTTKSSFLPFFSLSKNLKKSAQLGKFEEAL